MLVGVRQGVVARLFVEGGGSARRIDRPHTHTRRGGQSSVVSSTTVIHAAAPARTVINSRLFSPHPPLHNEFAFCSHLKSRPVLAELKSLYTSNEILYFKPARHTVKRFPHPIYICIFFAIDNKYWLEIVLKL